MSWLPAIITGALGLLGARESRKASERESERLSELSEPRLKMEKWALPRLRELIVSQLMPELTGEYPELRAAHEESLAQIGRQTRRQLAGSERYWSAQGNVGRGRGEQLRIKRAGTEAESGQRLQYAVQKRGLGEDAVTRLMNALGLSSNLGAQGLAPAIASIQAAGAGQRGYAEDLAGLAGWGMGYYGREQERKLYSRLWRDILGKK